MKKKQALEALKQVFAAHQLSLNSIDLTKLLPDVAAVVAELRAQADSAIAGIDSFVAKVDVAQDVNYAIDEVQRVFEWAQQAVQQATALATSATQATLSLNARVEDTIKARVVAGELIAKESHETAVRAAVEAARTDGESKGRAAVLALNSRRETVVAKGLPLPPDSVLGLDDAGFNSAVSAAESRKTLLGERTLSLNGVFAGVLYSDETHFKLALDAATEARSATPNPNPTKPNVPDLNRGGGSETKRPPVVM